MIDPALRAVACLSRVVEPSCPDLAELVARVGPVEAADRVKRREVDDSLLRLTEARHEIDSAARDRGVGAAGRSAGHRRGRRVAAAGVHRVRRC